MRIPDESTDRFWFVVLRCLELFHRRSRSETLGQVRRFRKHLHALSAERVEVFYHSEPFDVACRLANHPLDVRQYLDRYTKLCDEIIVDKAVAARQKATSVS